MNILLQVALGGAIGAVLRFLTVQGAVRLFGAGVPVGTFAVNVAGSFVMGLVTVWLVERAGGVRIVPFVMAGLLGGYTTFSAFSLDALYLYEDGRLGLAAVYVMGSVVVSVLALMAGVFIMRAVLA